MRTSHPLFLYQAPLNDCMATVSVTQHFGILQDTYCGNMALHVQDNPTLVHQRRAALSIALNKPIQWLNQVHGTKVYVAKEDKDTANHFNHFNHFNHLSLNVPLSIPTADAVITSNPQLAIAVMTADCLPVVVTAKNTIGGRAIGIAHAGWRGLLAGVLQNTCQALREHVPNAQLHAHLAPCIGAAQFEVGAEVYEAFTIQNADFSKHFILNTNINTNININNINYINNNMNNNINKKYLCNLEGLARQILHTQSIINITGGGFCTWSDPRFPSYRRTAITGRFATLVSFNN